MAAWLIDALASFFGGGLAVAIAGVLAKRWLDYRLQLAVVREQSSFQRGIEELKGEVGHLAQLRTTTEQQHAQIAAEALGATVRLLRVLRRTGRLPVRYGTSADPGSVEEARQGAFDRMRGQ
jgi:hypothetical protein